jgi:hypothetical protein
MRGRMAGMPRFKLKTLFILLTIVALWLSTFPAKAVGSDVRRGIVLFIVVASLLETYYSRGRRRAFSLGFTIIMLIMGTNIFSTTPTWPVPNFYWLTNLFVPNTPYNPLYVAANETIRAIATLLLAAVAGFVGVYICERHDPNAV